MSDSKTDFFLFSCDFGFEDFITRQTSAVKIVKKARLIIPKRLLMQTVWYVSKPANTKVVKPVKILIFLFFITHSPLILKSNTDLI